MRDHGRVHRFRDHPITGVNWRPTRFVDEVFRSHLCDLCGMIARKLVLLPCRHGLCQSCHTANSRGVGARCPFDQKPFGEEDCIRYDLPPGKADTMKVHCWNEDHGCHFEGPMEVMLGHYEKECTFHTTECARCGEGVLHRKLLMHYLAECAAAVSPVDTENATSEPKSLTDQDVGAALEEAETPFRENDEPAIERNPDAPAEHIGDQGSKLTATSSDVGESKEVVIGVAATTTCLTEPTCNQGSTMALSSDDGGESKEGGTGVVGTTTPLKEPTSNQRSTLDVTSSDVGGLTEVVTGVAASTTCLTEPTSKQGSTLAATSGDVGESKEVVTGIVATTTSLTERIPNQGSTLALTSSDGGELKEVVTGVAAPTTCLTEPASKQRSTLTATSDDGGESKDMMTGVVATTTTLIEPTYNQGSTLATTSTDVRESKEVANGAAASTTRSTEPTFRQGPSEAASQSSSSWSGPEITRRRDFFLHMPGANVNRVDKISWQNLPEHFVAPCEPAGTPYALGLSIEPSEPRTKWKTLENEKYVLMLRYSPEHVPPQGDERTTLCRVTVVHTMDSYFTLDISEDVNFMYFCVEFYCMLEGPSWQLPRLEVVPHSVNAGYILTLRPDLENDRCEYDKKTTKHCHKKYRVGHDTLKSICFSGRLKFYIYCQ
ncbi:hypothetical protein MRX96_017078 [Rhipicephalus microplus]